MIDGWNVRLINHVDKSRRSDCRLPTIDVLVAMVMAPTWLFWCNKFRSGSNGSNFANLIAVHELDVHGVNELNCPAETVFIFLAVLAAAWFSSDVCNREVRVKRDIMNVLCVWCVQSNGYQEWAARIDFLKHNFPTSTTMKLVNLDVWRWPNFFRWCRCLLQSFDVL